LGKVVSLESQVDRNEFFLSEIGELSLPHDPSRFGVGIVEVSEKHVLGVNG